MTAPGNSHRHACVLGAIADDVTGATDLATNLVQGGMQTVLVFGPPRPGELENIDAQAIVIALKSRSIAPEQAVQQSLRSLHALRELGASRFYFKYCSTFDSTDDGNIGPVAEALMDALSVRQTVFCPAFPQNGRTVYQGHLFVYGDLLNESGMEHHPLNPMRDSSIVRLLKRQVTRPVGSIPYTAITPDALGAELAARADDGIELVILDACDESHLRMIAAATADMPLVTGGSGLARHLPVAWRERGVLSDTDVDVAPPSVTGRAAILAGSCSAATWRQISFMSQRIATLPLSISLLESGPQEAVDGILRLMSMVPPQDPLLVYSAHQVQDVSRPRRLSGEELARAIEQFFALLAGVLVREHNVRRLIVAGGETSGAVVEHLGVRALRIGPEICPGVPWTQTLDEQPLALALKSGNFGDVDFFETALEVVT